MFIVNNVLGPCDGERWCQLECQKGRGRGRGLGCGLQCDSCHRDTVLVIVIVLSIF